MPSIKVNEICAIQFQLTAPLSNQNKANMIKLKRAIYENNNTAGLRIYKHQAWS